MDETPPESGSKQSIVLNEVSKTSSSIIPTSADLKSWNEAYLKKHLDDKHPSHVQYAVSVKQTLDPSSKDNSQATLVDILSWPETSLDDILHGIEVLKTQKAENKIIDSYLESARKRWPDASTLKSS